MFWLFSLLLVFDVFGLFLIPMGLGLNDAVVGLYLLGTFPVAFYFGDFSGWFTGSHFHLFSP
jgi:hypothetical protein